MTFNINTRIQIASICFFIIIMIDYFRYKHTNQRSSKWFNTLLGFTFIYLFSDIATVYTVNYMTDNILNRLTHQIFIGSLETIIFSLFMYVEVLGNSSRKANEILRKLMAIPYIVALYFVLSGDVQYQITDQGNYSYGPMVNTVYVISFIYVVVIFINTFRYRDAIGRKKRNALRIATGIWVFFAIFQYVFPTLLLSSLGIILEILVIYLSFENPNDNYDDATDSFNERAFTSVTTELFSLRKAFYIINIAVIDYTTINQNMGHKKALNLMQSINQYASELFDTTCYHCDENCMSIIFTGIIASNNSKLKQLAERMSLPFMVGDNSISISTSICVLPCPEFAEDIMSIKNWLSYAMYNPSCNSKAIVFVNNDLQKEKQREEDIVTLVAHAISNDGFDVYYQPIYSTDKQSFISAEALVRLKDTQTFGYLSPEIFIPIAEKNGLIMDLGRIVFDKVCAFASMNRLQSLGVEYIEVNLSGIQAVDTSLPDLLAQTIKSYHLEPSFINLEITETAAVSSGSMLRANMNRLRNLGFSFSMDDFGTGYSNLSQIADTAYDLVKLDKSLIWPCFGKNKSDNAMHILKNITEMLHDIGAHIVAEGVETEEMAEYLKELKVNYLQGYLYSKPINEESYLNFLNNISA